MYRFALVTVSSIFNLDLDISTIDVNPRTSYTNIDWNDKSMWVFAILLWLSHNVALWGGSAVFEIVYRLGWLKQYRIQPHKSVDEPLLLSAYVKLAAETLLTHIPIFIFIMYPAFRSPFTKAEVFYILLFFICLLVCSRRYGMEMSPDTIPTWTTAIWQVVVTVLACDTIFYWSHRLLHHPSIYGYIHKEHHKFKVSSGIASEFSHPVEGAINGFATAIGPILLGMHCSVFCVYLFFRILETVDAHSGYSLPFSPFTYLSGADRHDYHHAHNKGNFGMLHIWDTVCGTDESYLKWRDAEPNKKSE